LVVGATVCEIAPLSLHLVHVYWMPGAPLCGEVVAMVWLEPDPQENVCVVLYVVPSTVNVRPAGVV